MKRNLVCLALGLVLAGAALSQNSLSDDQRDACAAILCLSSGQRPNECTPPLRRYFSINHRKVWDTLRGRADFLNLCPAANSDAKMASLTDAIVNGAGRCDAASLNASQLVWQRSADDRTSYISNGLPSACTALATHAYTDLKNTLPLYVGTPQRQGYWVAPAEYAQAVQAYNTRLEAENTATAAAVNGR